jgi:DUF1707 SHOCT-like domain
MFVAWRPCGRIEGMDAGDLRAGDADRERVAERLRLALDEGRLNLHEYDERLRDAYGARTYGELDALLADLPNVTPPSQSRLVPASSTAVEPGHYPNATARWLRDRWASWFNAVAICTGIWGVTCLAAGKVIGFWPGWVAGPWGVVLLVGTINGLANGEPQRWAARRERRRAEREVRRQARREREDSEP